MELSALKRYLLPLLVAAAVLAQGPRSPQGNASSATGAGLNLAAQQVIEGAISSVQVAYGVRYPSIVVNQKTIRIAPVWYLLENDFELAPGDLVRVVAAPAWNDPTLHAISVEKLNAGVVLLLREEDGRPLWTRQPHPAPAGGGALAGPRFGSGCLDPASIATVSGIIESVSAGAGIQHPTLTLKTVGGLMTFKLGPERILLAADFELKAGESLTVRYGLASSTGALLTLSLTDAAGNVLVLRTDDGRPAWN